MSRLEKCYGITVRIENDRIRRKVFSGKFRISDGM
ncbi:FecR domain-containing protein, partial [Tannerella forsythia]